jgi:hypothetical protein
LALVHRLGSYVLKLTHREESSDCVAVTIGGHWARECELGRRTAHRWPRLWRQLRLMALANHLLHTFGVSGQFWRYAVSILPCTVKLQIGDEQGAEETLCSEPRRRSVQNRAGGRRGAAGDLRERCEATKRAGAASRLRVQCLSERPSISLWQRALRQRSGATDRLKRLGIGNVPVNPPPLYTVSGFWTNGERRRDPADAAQSGRTTASSSRCGVKLPEYAGLYPRPRR